MATHYSVALARPPTTMAIAASSADASAASDKTGTFNYFTDPNSRLNRIVDGMAHLDVEVSGRTTMATGTHDGTTGGRIFKVTKRNKKKQVSGDRDGGANGAGTALATTTTRVVNAGTFIVAACDLMFPLAVTLWTYLLCFGVADEDGEMAQYNYTMPEDVEYYLSDTDSEIGYVFRAVVHRCGR